MSKAKQAVSNSHERSTDTDQFSAVISETNVEDMDMLFRHISGTADEIKLKIRSDGLSFRTVDPANVAMTDAEIPKSFFDTYGYARDTVLGIDVGRFRDLLDDADGDVALQTGVDLADDSDDEDKPILQVGNDSMYLIDPDSIRREPDLPELDLPTTVTLTDMELVKHFVEATPSDHIQITGSEQGVTFSSEGDVSNARLELPDGNGCKVHETTSSGGDKASDENIHNFHDPIHQGILYDVSIFSQDYLENMFGKLLKKQRDCEYQLKMGTEFPLYLTRQDDSNIEYTYILAPRIRDY